MIYEVTLQHVMIDKNGNDKRMKERYVVQDAESFGEAEQKVYDEFGELYTDLDVVAVKRSALKEIANHRTNDEEMLWVVELQATFVDDNGNEKNVKYKILFHSTSFDAAKRYIADYISQGYNLEMVGLKLTNFKEVLI